MVFWVTTIQNFTVLVYSIYLRTIYLFLVSESIYNAENSLFKVHSFQDGFRT